MKEKRFDPTHIEMVDFKLIHGEIHSPQYFDFSLIESYNSAVTYEVGFNIEEELARSDIQFQIETVGTKNEEQAKGNFSFSFFYKIKGLKDYAEIKNEMVEVNQHLNISLASISYSTSRGIILTRFQGTVLKSFLLPVIDPVKLLKEEG